MNWRPNIHFTTIVHKVKLINELWLLKAVVGSPRQIHTAYQLNEQIKLKLYKTTLLVLNTNLTINWQANTLCNTLELIGIAVFYHLIGFGL